MPSPKTKHAAGTSTRNKTTSEAMQSSAIPSNFMTIAVGLLRKRGLRGYLDVV